MKAKKLGFGLIVFTILLYIVFNVLNNHYLLQRNMTDWEYYVYKVEMAYIFNSILSFLPLFGATLIFWGIMGKRLRLLFCLVLGIKGFLFASTLFRFFIYDWFALLFFALLVFISTYIMMKEQKKEGLYT